MLTYMQLTLVTPRVQINLAATQQLQWLAYCEPRFLCSYTDCLVRMPWLVGTTTLIGS